MHTKDFDYSLPQERIAQFPLVQRDQSRLMVVRRNKKLDTGSLEIEHQHFFDIVEHLKKGDLVVWNNSKVFKARLFGQLLSSDGDVLRDHTKPVEIFLIRPMENEGVWKVLAKPGRHVECGMRVVFEPHPDPLLIKERRRYFECEVMVKEKDGTILVQFADDAETVRAKANQYGHIPIPPYVKDEPHELDIYQTVYAKDEGSVAAPTAGFHFTPELIEKLKTKGVEFAEVTLHVGLGTFLPVKSERVEDHTMHSEWVEVSQETADAVNRAKSEGRRVIAVGTTTVRTLEGIALLSRNTYHITHNSGDDELLRDTCFVLREYTGNINLFILPGFKFQIVDAMITNFHLPKSTLLMLVSAIAGDREYMLVCYKKAVEEGYRFYSFGDAMIIM